MLDSVLDKGDADIMNLRQSQRIWVNVPELVNDQVDLLVLLFQQTISCFCV